MTVTVACLIKGRDEEAESYRATGQKVSRLTGPWNVKKIYIHIFFFSFLFFSFNLATTQLGALISLSSQSAFFPPEASLNACGLSSGKVGIKPWTTH